MALNRFQRYRIRNSAKINERRRLPCRGCGGAKPPGRRRAYCDGCEPRTRKDYAKTYYGKHKDRCAMASDKWRRRNPVTLLVNYARLRAKGKGIAFSITRDDVEIPTHCPVLGLPLKRGDGKWCDNSPTIDRINNDLGYVRGNITVVSWRANRLKANATPGELAALARFYCEGVAPNDTRNFRRLL